jgi:hypothetical protein
MFCDYWFRAQWTLICVRDCITLQQANQSLYLRFLVVYLMRYGERPTCYNTARQEPHNNLSPAADNVIKTV